MSSVKLEDANDRDLVDATSVDKADSDQSMDELKPSLEQEENPLPSLQQEEEAIKIKYGGILPRKKPLISKGHEQAFFDSADWALGKKAKGPLEALRPKLQPTPHQQLRSRRSAYARSDGNEEEEEVLDGSNAHDDTCSEDQSCNLDSNSLKNNSSGGGDSELQQLTASQ